MKNDTRRDVAYIAGRLISGKRTSSIYDYATSRYTSMSGKVDETRVNVYDHDAGCHVSGRPRSLYHYGHGSHLNLKVKGQRFSGYDYGTGSHFNGSVRGSSVSLYDYGTGRHYNYSL